MYGIGARTYLQLKTETNFLKRNTFSTSELIQNPLV